MRAAPQPEMSTAIHSSNSCAPRTGRIRASALHTRAPHATHLGRSLLCHAAATQPSAGPLNLHIATSTTIPTQPRHRPPNSSTPRLLARPWTSAPSPMMVCDCCHTHPAHTAYTGGPPRFFTPLPPDAPRPPLQDLPLLLYLPGIDGTGLAASSQVHPFVTFSSRCAAFLFNTHRPSFPASFSTLSFAASTHPAATAPPLQDRLRSSGANAPTRFNDPTRRIHTPTQCIPGGTCPGRRPHPTSLLGMLAMHMLPLTCCVVPMLPYVSSAVHLLCLTAGRIVWRRAGPCGRSRQSPTR